MKLEVLQNCPIVIRDFLTYSETIKGKSSRSVEGYYLDLQTFFRYLLMVRGTAPKDTEFEKIAIVGGKDEPNDMVSPCGVCRQVMAEFCDESFTVILGNSKNIKRFSLKEILPLSFTKKDL